MTKLTEGERLVITPQYLAGCIDCDGSVGIAKMKQTKRGIHPRYDMRVQLTNTDLRFIEAVQSQYGGYIRTVDRGRVQNPAWKTAYHLTWGTKASERLLNEILPFMIIKKERAEIALTLRETMSDRRGGQGSRLPDSVIEFREKLYQNMKILNMRGIQV